MKNARIIAIFIVSFVITGSLAAGTDPPAGPGCGNLVRACLTASMPAPSATITPAPIPTEEPTTTPTPDPVDEPMTTPSPTPAPTEVPTAAQTPAPVPTTPVAPARKPAKVPAISNYRGVSLNMDMDAVRKTLGSPKDKGERQDLFTFSGDESAQFFYDKEKKVRAIMVTFVDDPDALTPLQVFGEEVPPESDGSIFKMVRYPAAGYWISYNRSSGKDPVVSVAIQKF